MDREAWQATLHGVTESDMTGHAHMYVCITRAKTEKTSSREMQAGCFVCFPLPGPTPRICG